MHTTAYTNENNQRKYNSRCGGPCVIRQRPATEIIRGKTFSAMTTPWCSSGKSSSSDTTTSVLRQSTDPSGDGNGTKVHSHSDAAEAAASEQTAAAGQQQLPSRLHSVPESTTFRPRRVLNSSRIVSIPDSFKSTPKPIQTTPEMIHSIPELSRTISSRFRAVLPNKRPQNNDSHCRKTV